MPGKRDRIARSVLRTSIAVGFASFFPAFFGLAAFELMGRIAQDSFVRDRPTFGLGGVGGLVVAAVR